MDDKEIAEKCVEIIKQTYGPGKPGTHKKHCSICGLDFEEANDLDVLDIKGPGHCPNCTSIIAFQKFLKEHSDSFTKKESENELYENQWIEKTPLYSAVEGIKSYKLDEYEQKFETKNRTKRVKDFISRVEQGRKIIYWELGPKLEILQSIYERKDRFWLDGGNLMYHLKDATVGYIVLKLKELIESDSGFSINHLINLINNDKIYLFEKHKIVCIKKFRRSGDEIKTEYPRIETDILIKKIKSILDEYKVSIDAIKDYRNNQYAHSSKLDFPTESEKSLTYTNVKRIYNAVKIIFDGLLYSVAPDLFANLKVDYNMWFGHLNQISDYWRLYKSKK